MCSESIDGRLWYYYYYNDYVIRISTCKITAARIHIVGIIRNRVCIRSFTRSQRISRVRSIVNNRSRMFSCTIIIVSIRVRIIASPYMIRRVTCVSVLRVAVEVEFVCVFVSVIPAASIMALRSTVITRVIVVVAICTMWLPFRIECGVITPPFVALSIASRSYWHVPRKPHGREYSYSPYSQYGYTAYYSYQC